jgi:hypothetical protein
MKTLVFGVLILISGCSLYQLDNKKTIYELINLNFESKEKRGFKIYSKTIPFPDRLLNKNTFFDIDSFKRQIMVYNLGHVDTMLLDSKVDQADLDYIKQQILKPQILNLTANYLGLPDSVFTDVVPSIITDDPRTFFPDYSTYLISSPVFSNDKEFALIFEEKKCGLDCGGSQINYFIKNQQGDWEKIGFVAISLH